MAQEPYWILYQVVHAIHIELIAQYGGLKYLDDIVGIATNASVYDGKYLKYDHTIGKFVFDTINNVLTKQQPGKFKTDYDLKDSYSAPLSNSIINKTQINQ